MHIPLKANLAIVIDAGLEPARCGVEPCRSGSWFCEKVNWPGPGFNQAACQLLQEGAANTAAFTIWAYKQCPYASGLDICDGEANEAIPIFCDPAGARLAKERVVVRFCDSGWIALPILQDRHA